MSDLLWKLLPAVYRARDDQDGGGALRALTQVLQLTWDQIEAQNLELYDDWFVETAQPDRLPYIGSLVDAGLPDDAQVLYPALRAWVANIVRARKQKGTLASIALATRSASGWSVQAAVERASTGPRLGVEVWRIGAHPVELVPLRRSPRPGRHVLARYGPFGVDTPSFFGRQRHASADDGLLDVDHPIGIEELSRALEPEHRERRGPLYYSSDGALALYASVGDRWELIPAERLHVRSLADDLDLEGLEPEDGAVWIDPTRSRIAWLPGGSHPEPARASMSYGQLGTIGAGPQARRLVAPSQTLRLFVVADGAGLLPPSATEGWYQVLVFDTLTAALGSLGPLTDDAEQPIGTVIRIVDSARHPLERKGGALHTRVALGPAPLVIEAAPGHVPTVVGHLELAAAPSSQGSARLDGLVVDGRLIFRGPMRAEVHCCTVRPTRRAGEPAFDTSDHPGPDGTLEVRISRSLVGTVRAARDNTALAIEDSILDGRPRANGGATGAAPAGPAAVVTIGWPATGPDRAVSGIPRRDNPDLAAPPVTLSRTSILGGIRAAALQAVDAVLGGPISVDDAAASSLRTSATPEDVGAIPTDHCWRMSDPAACYAGLVFGRPDYFTLDPDAPAAVLEGGTDGQEMGAYHDAWEADRRQKLEDALVDFVPASLPIRLSYKN